MSAQACRYVSASSVFMSVQASHYVGAGLSLCRHKPVVVSVRASRYVSASSVIMSVQACRFYLYFSISVPDDGRY
jgi:hypothetical protein